MQSGGGQKEYSDSKAQEIDSEIHRIVMEGYNKAKRILNEHLGVLHEVSNALLEFETIDGEDVDMMINGGTIDDVRKRHGDRESAMAEEQKKAKEEMDKKVKLEEEEASSGIADAMGDPVTV